MKSYVLLVSCAPLMFALSSVAHASGFVSDADPDVPVSIQQKARNDISAEHPNRFFVRAGLTGALYHTSATVLTDGVVVPGASASTADQYTFTGDLGYFLTHHISLSLFAGVPIKPTLYGAGSAAPFGALGSVLYGPAIVSVSYHIDRLGRFQPYVGGGAAYAIVFKDYDGAIAHLKVPDHLGYALQAGAEYRVNRKVALYTDFKQIFIFINASGTIEGGVQLGLRSYSIRSCRPRELCIRSNPPASSDGLPSSKSNDSRDSMS